MTMKVEGMTDETAGQWHHHLLTESVSTALSADIWLRAAPRPQDRCVDLGAGVGMLALPLSGEVAEVVAVEPSRILAARLGARARESGCPAIRTENVQITELIMPRRSCDLIVSGLALHHYDNPEKRALVSRALRWLRPGGRLVIADLMSDRPRSVGLRRQLPNVSRSNERGRIDRSAGRFFRSTLHSLRETTATGEFWVEAFEDAGFQTVGHRQSAPGIGVVWGAAESN
ncbi:class I SAM-dependent methyltransferase [Actinomadura geliboluensis]|uniref:Class I SAM-dependent methyltransferase n=1 Tax=Actinomadura geliboluensis TaxID=882440 RepID=A0A5S4HAI7_9ACTN|nr:class I SAM-dependent methyltransferase [Actinomadura geliboluensis]TMR42233.1 class I SAM-dependent methyltransferase [Actinomadura geliboluensis]